MLVVATGLEAAAVAAVNDIRRMNEDDLPWLWYLCSKRYPHKFSGAAAASWFRRFVFRDQKHFYAARTDHAFTVSRLDIEPWFPDDPEVHVMLACADHGHGLEILGLLRDSVEWAKQCNCTTWRCCSNTEYDFAPIARFLGADEQQPRFVMRLKR